MVVQLEDVFGVARAGEPAGHDRRASQLAAQAAADAGGWRRDDARCGAGAARSPRRAAGARDRRAQPAGARTRRIPRATYRLQLHARLHVRATRRRSSRTSPRWASATSTARRTCSARPGSTHGYDIVDHNELNPEIGTRGGFRALRGRRCATTAWARCSTWCPTTWASWARTTRGGWTCSRTARRRRYADFFDIDWHAGEPRACANKVLLPVLGDHYGVVLERGELKLAFEPATGEFGVLLLTSTASRSIRASTRASSTPAIARARGRRAPTRARRRARARCSPPSRTCRARRDRRAARIDRAPARQGGAQAPARAPRARAPGDRRAPSSTRVQALQRHAGRPAASTPARAARARRTGSRTGAWPPTRSTTGASSTSTTSRRCAWRTRRCSRRRTGSSLRLVRERQGRRRCASTIPTACTTRAQYFAAAQLAGPRRDGRPRGRYVVVEKIVARHENAAARLGACTAPPATASPTW